MKRHCSLALLFLCMLVLPLQAKDVAYTPSFESNDPPLVSELSVEQFSEVVKAIVQKITKGFIIPPVRYISEPN